MCRWNINNILDLEKIKNLQKLDYEVSVILYLNDQKIRGREFYDRTGDKEGVSLPSLEEIVNGCKINNTNKVILIHNHPYYKGICNSEPSYGDLFATENLNNKLKQVGIILLDHIILGQDKSYFSFKANDLI